MLRKTSGSALKSIRSSKVISKSCRNLGWAHITSRTTNYCDIPLVSWTLDNTEDSLFVLSEVGSVLFYRDVDLDKSDMPLLQEDQIAWTSLWTSCIDKIVKNALLQAMNGQPSRFQASRYIGTSVKQFDVTLIPHTTQPTGRLLLIAICRDLSVEHDLMLKYARAESYIESTDDAVIAFDINGAITTWNPAAVKILGYPAEEAIGKTYRLIGSPKVYEHQDAVFREVIGGKNHHYDTIRRRKDGSVVDVQVTTSRLVISGEIEGIIAILRNITDKVRAAAELRERNNLLDSTLKQVAQLNRQLVESADDKRRFFNMVTHDLRHPITSILTLVYLLRCEEDSNLREEHLIALEGRTNALRNLLDELNEYHKIEAGRTQLNIEWIDPNKVISECIENFAPATVSGPVRLITNLDTNLKAVECDTGKLNHILLNLLSNALKFTLHGSITISTLVEDDKFWALLIADTGHGMAPDVQAKVFDEFFQASDSSSQRGSGIGLSIVKKLCDALNAEIKIESTVGYGTQFTIRFPVAYCEL